MTIANDYLAGYGKAQFFKFMGKIHSCTLQTRYITKYTVYTALHLTYNHSENIYMFFVLYDCITLYKFVSVFARMCASV